MTRYIVSGILVAISVALFVVYIQPTYAEVGELRETQAQFDEALQKSRELQSVRDELISRFNTFSPEDLTRIRKILPDAVDNVRLILEIDNIAARYGIPLSEVSVETEEDSSETDELSAVQDQDPYESVVLGFSFETEYELFLQLVEDLQNSLRLVDITSITFRSNEDDFNNYSIKIRTYWLP